MFNPNKFHLRAFTGKDGFLSLAAAKLRCNGRKDNSINPFITRALSSSCGDDDFSELGSPVPKAATSLRKLRTEKPEPYNKKASRRKKSAGVPSESSTSLKRDSSKLESVGASKRPVLSDVVSVPCSDPTIHPLGYEEAVNIRITNINLETTDSAIHSMCMSYGSLEGLVRTKEDAVDAFFSIKDNADIDSILAKLNDTVMNDHKWSANLLQRDSTPAVTSKQSNLNVGLHISHQLAEVRRQVNMKTVCIEDLEYLHHALVHLEAHPDSMASISKDD